MIFLLQFVFYWAVATGASNPIGQDSKEMEYFGVLLETLDGAGTLGKCGH